MITRAPLAKLTSTRANNGLPSGVSVSIDIPRIVAVRRAQDAVRHCGPPTEVAASLDYAINQRLRKRIDKSFGWSKTVGGLAQVKVRGLAKVHAVFVFALAAYNLVRLPRLLAPTGEVCPAT